MRKHALFVNATPVLKISNSRSHATTSPRTAPRRAAKRRVHGCTQATRWMCSGSTQAPGALILDCDGVIVESEEIHRLAYNDCWAANSLGFEWSSEFYERLQNTVGGGKEKMAWYFEEHAAWPAELKSASADERWEYVKTLHAQKTELYVKRVAAGVPARRGITRMIDEALERGVAVAVASAANGDAVRAVLRGALGTERLDRFAVVLAGDDVKAKKPAPDIYLAARAATGVPPEQCVVVEDSLVGMKAAVAAGLRVVVTYTDYTKDQDFSQAEAVYGDFGELGDEKCISLTDILPHLAGVTA